MHTSTSNPSLKVLTPVLAGRLQGFNEAARALRRVGIRLHHFDPVGHRLTIDPEGGRQLLKQRLVDGFTRSATAGSTKYTVQFMGVTLEWREAISYTRPEEWATTH
ncbi:hypothetical protein [Stutzerimonas stutzeri]|uniref:hypothetical protein n=1 Tax=Stutzerimonas stutzeri TaxID=316 RepID=UPI00210CE292|nr:hypothetical protein [Stutzerimonas stutzeri]MCQ4242386.1 hypothetical protein [Stutzerimonas stutzeri]